MTIEVISDTLDVDVFILSYKRPLFLSEAIKSVLAQTQPPKQITILDNGSDNGVKEVVEDFLQYGVSWDGVETAHSAGWNFRRAVSKANSKYCFIMHDDDRLCPDFLEKQIDFLEKNKNIIASGCNGYIINSEGLRTGALILEDRKRNRIFDSSVKVALNYAMNSCLVFASFVYRTLYIKQIRTREEFEKVGDVVLLCDLADIGPIAHQELSLYEVRIHSGQDSVNIPEYQSQLLNDFFLTKKCEDLRLVRCLHKLIRRNQTHRAIRKWLLKIENSRSPVAIVKNICSIQEQNISIMELLRFLRCNAKNIYIHISNTIKLKVN